MFSIHTQRPMRNRGAWQSIEALEARELLSAALVHHAVKATTPASGTAAIHVDAKAKQKTSNLRTTVAVVQKKAAKAVAQGKTKASSAAALKKNALNARRGEQIAKATRVAATFGNNPIQPSKVNTSRQPKTPQNPLAGVPSGVPGISSASAGANMSGPGSTTLTQILAASGPAAQMKQFTAGIGQGPGSAAGLVGLGSGQTGITLQSPAAMASDFQRSAKGGLPSSPTFGDSRLMDGSSEDESGADNNCSAPEEESAATTDSAAVPTGPGNVCDPIYAVCGETVDGTYIMDGKKQSSSIIKDAVGKAWAAVCDVVGTCDPDLSDQGGAGPGVRGMPNPDAVDPDAELPPWVAVLLPKTAMPTGIVNAPVNQLEPDNATARNGTFGKAPLTEETFEHRLDPLINNGENGQSSSDSKLILPATASRPQVDPRDLVKAAAGGTPPAIFGR